MDFKKKRKFWGFWGGGCRFKKNSWKQTLSQPHPTQTTPGRGKKSSGQERRKERSKEKWWKLAEIPRDRQRLGGRYEAGVRDGFLWQ